MKIFGYSVPALGAVGLEVKRSLLDSKVTKIALEKMQTGVEWLGLGLKKVKNKLYSIVSSSSVLSLFFNNIAPAASNLSLSDQAFGKTMGAEPLFD